MRNGQIFRYGIVDGRVGGGIERLRFGLLRLHSPVIDYSARAC